MEPLEPAAAFPYLGRTVTFNNSNWVELYQKPYKAQRQWEMAEKVLTRMGVTVRMRAMIYKAMVQTVLIYGRGSWVVMGSV